MMQKFVAPVAVAIGLVGIAHAEAELFARPAEVPFVLDGSFVENVYAGYDWSASFVAMDRENALTNGLYEAVEPEFRSLNTQVGVFTQDKCVYVCFLAPVPPGREIDVEKDGVGAFLTLDGKDVLGIRCNAKGNVSAVRIGADGAKETIDAAGVRAGVKVSKRSLGVEIEIPVASIGEDPRATGARWKCNFFRYGPSCGGCASWMPVAPTPGGLYEVDRFGTVAFGKAKTSAGPLPENVGKVTFLWEGTRWASGDMDAKAPLDEKELDCISLAAPRNARAMAHFRVSNLSARHQIYTLTADDWQKNRLAAKVRFREMGYVELKGGPTIADPIYELPNGSVLRIPPRTTAIVWVDVETYGMKSGVQKAKIRLVPGCTSTQSGQVEKTLDLELTVGKADISEIDMPVWAYAVRHPYQYRMLADYRINTICMMPGTYAPPLKNGVRDWRSYDEAVEAVLGTGVKTNEVRVLMYHLFDIWTNKRLFRTSAWENDYVEGLRASVAHAKERWGIGYDRLYVSTIDEPHGAVDDGATKAGRAFYGARLVRQADPKLKTFANPYKTAENTDRYLETFDALEPFLGSLRSEDPSVARRYAESGKEIWSYTILLKQNQPAQYRKACWQNVAYGFEGPCCFYDMQDGSGDPFDSYDGKNGGGPDYNAVYFDRRTERCVVSRRSEAWFLGVVEQKLLKWCRLRIAALKASGKPTDAYAARLEGLVRRGAAPRSDSDACGLELMKLSDELFNAR